MQSINTNQTAMMNHEKETKAKQDEYFCFVFHAIVSAAAALGIKVRIKEEEGKIGKHTRLFVVRYYSPGSVRIGA